MDAQEPSDYHEGLAQAEEAAVNPHTEWDRGRAEPPGTARNPGRGLAARRAGRYDSGAAAPGRTGGNASSPPPAPRGDSVKLEEAMASGSDTPATAARGAARGECR